MSFWVSLLWLTYIEVLTLMLLIWYIHCLSLLLGLQVDAGRTCGANHDCGYQPWCLVLLLLRHRLLWTLVADIPPERLVLSPNTGTPCHLTHRYGELFSFSALCPICLHHCVCVCWNVQVHNGLALYTTWTAIASLINFSLVLHLWGVSRSTAATASLCILFGEVMTWWVLVGWD